jgi:hypothetical protein
MPSSNNLVVLDNGGLEALGVGDVDGLDVGVKLLLGVLLIVTLTRDADTETEGDTLDAALPDLLVQLGVEADVGGTLSQSVSWSGRDRKIVAARYD